MYILYICVLAPLLQIGFSLNEEETDLNSLSSNYNGLDNPEIWNSEEDTGISMELLEKICMNYNQKLYIAQDDVTIDCEAFNSNGRPVEQNHDVIKREADETDEGSGNHETIVDSKEGEEAQTDSNATETKTETTTKSPEQTTIQPKQTTMPPEQTTLPPEQTTMPPEQTTMPPEPPTTSTEPTTTTSEPTTTTSEPTTTTPEPTTTAPELTTTTPEPTTEPPIEKEDNIDSPPFETDKTQTNAKEDVSKETKEEDPKKNVEVIKGKTLIHKTNEENREAESGDPGRTKESTESPKKASSKDTTILVVLFVAVVVVGAAAFGYNFIKKRKQRSADLERVERAPSIKRSLQNLTKPEAEPEKKPLIGESKEVEMVDMKREAPAENNSKPLAGSVSTDKNLL